MNLHVISCLFNPADSVRIRENYHTFRGHLGNIPVTTVELLFPGQQRITSQDDHNSHLITGDRERHSLWQKERLLNLAIKTLPAECDAIAWIDADVIFADPNWTEVAIDALKQMPVVQLFSNAHWLGSYLDSERWFESFAVKQQRNGGWGHPGFAWAARREAIEQAGGLFDLDCLGSGDTWMAYGFTGRNFIEMASRPQLQIWHRWMIKASKAARRRIGLADLAIAHLYHGEQKDRQYRDRQQWKKQFNYNPARDIMTDDNGLLAWTGNNPDLERVAKAYFPSRNDDGRTVPQTMEIPA